MEASNQRLVGIDLFAGAGGMSLGAQMAGIDVLLAVEKDPYAATTYAHNHPSTDLIIEDIKNIRTIDIVPKGAATVLFGGPPCQGFSTSNQRTRNRENTANWLFKEFIRIASLLGPDWVVIENVQGIVYTEQGLFVREIVQQLTELGYTSSYGIVCASNHGVPQIRSRFFLIASRHGQHIELPTTTTRNPVTVRQALSGLPSLPNGASVNYLKYPRKSRNKYATTMRNGLVGCAGHLVTRNAQYVIDRYKHVPQGGNWQNIPKRLMLNYKNCEDCHTGIYRRLKEDDPSVVLGNYRKNMLIHPNEDRGLSVREAARLQSFPDWYEFKGSIGFQQQQVGNAVPPLLARSVFAHLKQQAI